MQDFRRVLDLIVSKRRMEQFNFFNWLSNVRNLVYINCSHHMRKVIQWHYNSFFSKKSYKILPSGWGLYPRTPYVIRLSYTNLLNTFPNLDISTFKFSFEPSPFRKILGNCQTRFCLLIFHFTILLSFRKFLMTSLHVICGLDPPPIKNPGYAHVTQRLSRIHSSMVWIRSTPASAM